MFFSRNAIPLDRSCTCVRLSKFGAKEFTQKYTIDFCKYVFKMKNRSGTHLKRLVHHLGASLALGRRQCLLSNALYMVFIQIALRNMGFERIQFGQMHGNHIRLLF